MPREDKHGTTDAPHIHKERGADAEAEVLEGAQQCAGELPEEQVQRAEPEAAEQEETVTEADGMDRDERLASDEADAAQAQAGCSAGMSSSTAAGQLAASCLTGDSDCIPANFAASNQQPAVESGYPSNPSPSKAEQKLEVSPACAALEAHAAVVLGGRALGTTLV